uniref:Protein kinase domain containing protein n=1 Tax=Babesia bovis TaxID=5865 RepID=S6BFJ5_BABBO|nr:protein kinase domain containing protein [Babesia bovis]
MSVLFLTIKQGKFHLPSHLSKDARWLLQRMLDVNPASRITMRELLSHPWFIGCNYDHVSLNTEAYINGFSDPQLVFPGVLGTSRGGFGILPMEKPHDKDTDTAKLVSLRCNSFVPRWSIGIPGFTSELQCIKLVTTTLQDMGYKWLFVPCFRIYCRRDIEPSKGIPPTYLMQIYKMKYRFHILDIHIGSGALMPALDEGIRIREAIKSSLQMATL